MTLAWSRYPVDNMLALITGRFAQDYGGYLHRGVDVGVPVSTPVYAPAEGFVVRSGSYGSFGNAVVLDHADHGLFSIYAHLDNATVNPGEWMLPGELIGWSGNTGLSTGPHLHWQICVSPDFPTDISFSRDPLGYPLEEEDMSLTEERVKELATGEAVKVVDNATGVVLLSLLEQGLGIVPSTFDPENQRRFDAILAALRGR